METASKMLTAHIQMNTKSSQSLPQSGIKSTDDLLYNPPEPNTDLNIADRKYSSDSMTFTKEPVLVDLPQQIQVIAFTE